MEVEEDRLFIDKYNKFFQVEEDKQRKMIEIEINKERKKEKNERKKKKNGGRSQPRMKEIGLDYIDYLCIDTIHPSLMRR